MTVWHCTLHITICDEEVMEWLLYEGAELPDNYKVTDLDRKGYIENHLDQASDDFDFEYEELYEED